MMWSCSALFKLAMAIMRKYKDQKYGNKDFRVFKREDTKLERVLPKNQHTQRKLLDFVNWFNEEVSKNAKI